MKVLFLILNYKTYVETIRLTDDLLFEDLNEKHILIVDNASPNESYQVLKEKYCCSEHIEVIQSPENGGYARGNNFGLRYAKKYTPQYVCIINNDVYFSMCTIDRLCSWYSKLPSSTAFIAPRQILPNGKEAIFRNMDVPTIWTDLSLYIPFSAKKHLYVENCNIKGVNEIGIIPGAFIFTSYSRFESLGFFDECTFLFCEERFIAKKVQMIGMKNYIILEDTYLHNHSTTIKEEASEQQQRKMIFDGRCKYHKRFSKYSFFSVRALKIMYTLNETIFLKLIRLRSKYRTLKNLKR